MGILHIFKSILLSLEVIDSGRQSLRLLNVIDFFHFLFGEANHLVFVDVKVWVHNLEGEAIFSQNSLQFTIFAGQFILFLPQPFILFKDVLCLYFVVLLGLLQLPFQLLNQPLLLSESVVVG